MRSSRTATSRGTSTATWRASASRRTSRCSPRRTSATRASRSQPSRPRPRRPRLAARRGDRDSYEERPAHFDMRAGLDPEAAQIHQWGNVYPHYGPYNHRRVRKGDIDWAFDDGGHDRRGRLPPAGDRADAAGDAGRDRRPGGQRAADDLLLHPGHVLLHGRRGGPSPGAAEQAEVRRRHCRRRLRRQGRHRNRDDLRAARAQGAATGQVALDARGGVPRVVDARAVAHGDRRRRLQGRLDPGPADADTCTTPVPTRASRRTASRSTRSTTPARTRSRISASTASSASRIACRRPRCAASASPRCRSPSRRT